MTYAIDSHTFEISGLRAPYEDTVICCEYGVGVQQKLLQAPCSFHDVIHLDTEAYHDMYQKITHALDNSVSLPSADVMLIVHNRDIGLSLGMWERATSPLLYEHYYVPLRFLCEALHNRGIRVRELVWVSGGWYGSMGEDIKQARTAAKLCPWKQFHHPLVDAAEELRRGGVEEKTLIAALIEDIIRLDNDLIEPCAPSVVGCEFMVSEKWKRDALQMMLTGQHAGFSPGILSRISPENFLAYAKELATSDTAVGAMVGFSSQVPKFSVVWRAISYMRTVSSIALPQARADIVAMVAYMEWAVNAKSAAHVDSLYALELDDRNSLARLIARACEAGLEPLWCTTHVIRN